MAWRRLVAIGVPTLLLIAHAASYGAWIVDDAGISFGYARSIASGLGPVLRAGAPAVEGYSNPAWVALLVLGKLLGLFEHGSWFGLPDIVGFPKLLALLCCVGIFACYYSIAQALSARPVLVTIVAGTATAAIPSFVLWCFSGMENSLLALSVVGLATVLVRFRNDPANPRLAVYSGLLVALAALTRPDGLVYLLALPVLLLCLRARARGALLAMALHLLAFAVPCGCYLAWRLAVFGRWLPNTAVAKSQGLPTGAGLVRPGEILGYAGFGTVLLLAAALGIALYVGRARGLFVLLVPLGLGFLAFMVLNEDWMPQLRFASPIWSLGGPIAVLALERAAGVLHGRALRIGALGLALALVCSLAGLVSEFRGFRARPTVPLCLVARQVGQNVNDYAELLGLRKGTVLAADVGGGALVGRLRIIDLAGLTDQRMAEYWNARDWRALRRDVFAERRPDFLVVHGAWGRITGLFADPRLAREYARISQTEWVRTDLVGTKLAQLREHAERVAEPAERFLRAHPLRACGELTRSRR